MNPLLFCRIIGFALGIVVMIYRRALWALLSVARVPLRVRVPLGAAAAVMLFWGPFLPLLFRTEAPVLVRVGAVFAVGIGAAISASRWSTRVTRR